MSKSGKADQLIKNIGVQLEQQPYAFEGFSWAAAPQQWWCDQLGISAPTLRRLISGPPFVRKRTHVGGRIVTLLRLGSPEGKTPRDYANILSAIWRKRTGRRVSPREFGCCCGLVEVWPDGKAPQMLNMVLDHWDVFMAGAKLQMDEKLVRYYRYPSLPVIRLYASVVCEMLVMAQQLKMKGPASPAELNSTLKFLPK